jgi:transposase
MAATRKQYSAKFKARVAVEAIRGEKTLNQLGSQFGLHPVQIAHWRRTALDHIEDLFVDGRTRHSQKAETDAEEDALFEEIGRLKVELDFVKKKAGMLE